MFRNRETNFISRVIAGISLALVALLFSALFLTACGGNNAELIGEEKAKEIVLSHSGILADNVTRYRLERDHDDRRAVYEIEFWSGNVEYDYEVDAKSGEIISFSKDMR